MKLDNIKFDRRIMDKFWDLNIPISYTWFRGDVANRSLADIVYAVEKTDKIIYSLLCAALFVDPTLVSGLISICKKMLDHDTLLKHGKSYESIEKEMLDAYVREDPKYDFMFWAILIFYSNHLMPTTPKEMDIVAKWLRKSIVKAVYGQRSRR